MAQTLIACLVLVGALVFPITATPAPVAPDGVCDGVAIVKTWPSGTVSLTMQCNLSQTCNSGMDNCISQGAGLLAWCECGGGVGTLGACTTAINGGNNKAVCINNNCVDDEENPQRCAKDVIFNASDPETGINIKHIKCNCP